jgi:hypothetical protein
MSGQPEAIGGRARIPAARARWHLCRTMTDYLRELDHRSNDRIDVRLLWRQAPRSEHSDSAARAHTRIRKRVRDRTTRSIVAAVAVAASLGGASIASAHELVNGQATCTGLTAGYAGFDNNEKPITYAVTVDTVAQTNGTFTFPGSSGTLSVPFAAPLPAGNHEVVFTSTWPGQGNENGAFTETVYGCPGPPTPPPSPTPPAPQTPPVATPPTPTAAVSHVKQSRVRRFGTKRVKKCTYGRRQLRDSRGRRFTMCRTKPKPIAARTPHFTG